MHHDQLWYGSPIFISTFNGKRNLLKEKHW
jgi:hypothetical protein